MCVYIYMGKVLPRCFLDISRFTENSMVFFYSKIKQRYIKIQYKMYILLKYLYSHMKSNFLF